MSDNSTPLHWLVQTRTYDYGHTARDVMPHPYTPADEAERTMHRRLRDRGVTFTSGPGWVEYREEPPSHLVSCTVRLEWASTNPEERL